MKSNYRNLCILVVYIHIVGWCTVLTISNGELYIYLFTLRYLKIHLGFHYTYIYIYVRVCVCACARECVYLCAISVLLTGQFYEEQSSLWNKRLSRQTIKRIPKFYEAEVSITTVIVVVIWNFLSQINVSHTLAFFSLRYLLIIASKMC